MHDVVALGDATATWAIHTYRVNLVEISHRAIALGDIANFSNRRDVAVHRIDRLETDQLRTPRIGVDKAALEADGIIVAKYLVVSAAVPDSLDHRGVVCRIGEDDTVGNLSRQCGNSGLIRDVSRGEEQRSLLAMEVGK